MNYFQVVHVFVRIALLGAKSSSQFCDGGGASCGIDMA